MWRADNGQRQPTGHIPGYPQTRSPSHETIMAPMPLCDRPTDTPPRVRPPRAIAWWHPVRSESGCHLFSKWRRPGISSAYQRFIQNSRTNAMTRPLAVERAATATLSLLSTPPDHSHLPIMKRPVPTISKTMVREIVRMEDMGVQPAGRRRDVRCAPLRAQIPAIG